MERYRIGRIEGRWKNFVPPIQGGVFRPYHGEEAEGEEDALGRRTSASDQSSSSSSRAPSPVFDGDSAGEHGASQSGVRRRGAGAGASSTAHIPRSDSISSATSISEDGCDVKDSGAAFLDAQTRERIELDLGKYPSLDAATQADIVERYRRLNNRIKSEGLYQCNYGAYGIECIRYATLFALFVWFLRLGWYTTSGVFLGLTWHQLVFTAHDAGHMGITHHFHVDTVIGIIIADFIGGLSIGWWKRNHNVHHIVTNSPEHDPDIEHMPFLAISHRLLQSLYSTYYDRVMAYDAVARVFIAIQAKTYYIVMLFGRFNLYRNSWAYLLSSQPPQKGIAWWHWYLEMAGQVFFWFWYGYLVMYLSIPDGWSRFAFLMASHLVTAPLHVQITLSHFAMSTADLGPSESFPQRMLRTTMDVDCPQWLDFIHGGLQFQVIHHLYPRIPRHNLRRVQKLVQEFCDEVGIPYALYGFVDGNKQVVGRLAEVSRQAAIFSECQKALAAELTGNAQHRHHHH